MTDTHDERASQRTPKLGAMCSGGGLTNRQPKHEWCGGWWCTCPCHDAVEADAESRIGMHVGHKWRQAGNCVWCCDERLYNGRVTNILTEQVAIGEFWDQFASKTATDWAEMRTAVLTARASSER